MNEGTEVCESLLSCTLYLFYQSMSEGGNIKAVLGINSPGHDTYLPRIAYDSLFFIWVGIVLMNVITGEHGGGQQKKKP